MYGKVKRLVVVEPERKRVRSGRVESCITDPKPRELAMARVKPGYDPVEARTHHCCKSGG